MASPSQSGEPDGAKLIKSKMLTQVMAQMGELVGALLIQQLTKFGSNFPCKLMLATLVIMQQI